MKIIYHIDTEFYESRGEIVEIRKLEANQMENIKNLFKSVFMNDPWNDDWSDSEQLNNYILDLTGNRNSLSIGLYDGDELVGVSLGSIMHWCQGTEYYIYEFFIIRERQGNGLGTIFLTEIEKYVQEMKVNHIFLQTERELPAYKFYQKLGFVELEGHASLVKMFD